MLRRSILLLGLLAFWSASIGSHPAFAEVPVKATEVPVKAQDGHEPKKHLPLAPGHESAEEPDILKADAPLAIWTLIVFIGLMVILGRFAWKPLMKALQEREAHLEQVLLDSERARNEAEAIAAENRRELAQAAEKARLVIEEATKQAQAAASSILAKAQADAEATRQRAEREIAGAKDQALMEIWSSTADLAVSVAGKVLSRELGDADHKRLVEMAMGELPANGQGSRS